MEDVGWKIAGFLGAIFLGILCLNDHNASDADVRYLGIALLAVAGLVLISAFVG